MVCYHGSEQAFRLGRRMGFLAMGRERLNAALGLLVHNDFVRLIEPGTDSKPPLFEWPMGAVSAPSGVAARAGSATARRDH